MSDPDPPWIGRGPRPCVNVRSRRFRPGLEPLEEKQPLSAGASTAHLADVKAAGRGGQRRRRGGRPAAGPPLAGRGAVEAGSRYRLPRVPPHEPDRFNNHTDPPFGHVLVQARQPVPGPGLQHPLRRREERDGPDVRREQRVRRQVPRPALLLPDPDGDRAVEAGAGFIFYVLTKKYYPLPNQVTSGFEFNLGGAMSIAIPGPSGIFLRMQVQPRHVRQDPRLIVARGQGAQGGKGIKFGHARHGDLRVRLREDRIATTSAATSSRPRRRERRPDPRPRASDRQERPMPPIGSRNPRTEWAAR